MPDKTRISLALVLLFPALAWADDLAPFIARPTGPPTMIMQSPTSYLGCYIIKYFGDDGPAPIVAKGLVNVRIAKGQELRLESDGSVWRIVPDCEKTVPTS